MLAGIITEGQYKAKLNENEEYVPYQFDDEKGKELYLKYDNLMKILRGLEEIFQIVKKSIYKPY
jgi:hypothetical protein